MVKADSRTAKRVIPAAEKAEAAGLRVPLARCAFVIPRRGTPNATGFASSWQGGSFAPRCIPQSRTFGPCTRPDALRLLDFRPLFRQRLRRGEPSCPPSTSRPGETSLSPWPPFDHGPCPVDPRRMSSAPAPLTNPARIGCAALRATMLRPRREQRVIAVAAIPYGERGNS